MEMIYEQMLRVNSNADMFQYMVYRPKKKNKYPTVSLAAAVSKQLGLIGFMLHPSVLKRQFRDRRRKPESVAL